MSFTECWCECIEPDWWGALTIDPVVLRDVCANVLLVWGWSKRAAERAVLAQEIRRRASIEILI